MRKIVAGFIATLGLVAFASAASADGGCFGAKMADKDKTSTVADTGGQTQMPKSGS